MAKRIRRTVLGGWPRTQTVAQDAHQVRKINGIEKQVDKVTTGKVKKSWVISLHADLGSAKKEYTGVAFGKTLSLKSNYFPMDNRIREQVHIDAMQHVKSGWHSVCSTNLALAATQTPGNWSLVTRKFLVEKPEKIAKISKNWFRASGPFCGGAQSSLSTFQTHTEPIIGRPDLVLVGNWIKNLFNFEKKELLSKMAQPLMRFKMNWLLNWINWIAKFLSSASLAENLLHMKQSHDWVLC